VSPVRGAAIGTVLLALLGGARATAAAPGDPKAGRDLYDRRCAPCHGVKGDGNGPAAELLDPRPRDFTSGIFKVRTTSTKAPFDQDLFAVITNGMPGTYMPAWGELSDRERWNLVAYIKTFAPDRFKETPKPQELPKEVGPSPESIKRGKEMFEAIECNKCHGAEGRADGPSRPDLKDDWGHPIKPANLTKRWNFRGGATAREIAMRLATGVNGTPMPSFIDSVEKPEDIWHLANYLVSLGPASPNYATLVTAAAVRGALPEDPEAEFWKKIAPENIAMVGQVTVDPRNFNPAIDLVALRAAYNDREIAFHLTWDDPTQSTPDPARQVYADAISLQFPLTPAPGPERPYFLMGSDAEGVYLLRWENGKGATEATANGPTKVTLVAGSEARGTAVFRNGRYRLVIKRALARKDAPTFAPGVFLPIAFQAWDGGAGETGPKMSLTSWYYLRLEEPQSNRRFVIPPLAALLTVVAMALIVRTARGWTRNA
jgi:DMSO reductase family type II enzyme heme b subunit